MWKLPYYDIEKGIDWTSLQKYRWFSDMEKTPQDPIWHAEGNVQIHTKRVCEELIKLPEFQELSEQDKHILLTSALFHDIEKRSTTTEEVIDNLVRIVAPSHAKRGEKTARELLYVKYNTPYHIREEICKLVRYHGLPLWNIDDSTHLKVIESSLYVRNNLLTMLAKADILGRECEDKGEQLEKIDFFKLLCEENECLYTEKKFKNNLSRHKFLNEGGWSGMDIYDDKEFTVYVMSGIPGSGKDTYISKFLSDIRSISLDDIRRERGVKIKDKKENGRVIQIAKEHCKENLRIKESFVFNATNISKDMRSKWINLFLEYGAKVEIIYIESNYKDLLKQNSNRDYKVPETYIQKMLSKLDIPTYDESHNLKVILNN